MLSQDSQSSRSSEKPNSPIGSLAMHKHGGTITGAASRPHYSMHAAPSTTTLSSAPSKTLAEVGRSLRRQHGHLPAQLLHQRTCG